MLGNQVYGPYGNQRYSSGAVGTSKGFTGQYADATGLDYFNARYYDPVVGRFMSADTVDGNGSGDDPYAYVNGNPETANDPTGHYMVGGDGSTANTESDGNGGTRVTIHQSDGSTQSTDETGTPDPIPGAPAPSPHAAPATHTAPAPKAARPNPKLIKGAAGKSTKVCNDDSDHCDAWKYKAGQVKSKAVNNLLNKATQLVLAGAALSVVGDFLEVTAPGVSIGDKIKAWIDFVTTIGSTILPLLAGLSSFSQFAPAISKGASILLATLSVANSVSLVINGGQKMRRQ